MLIAIVLLFIYQHLSTYSASSLKLHELLNLEYSQLECDYEYYRYLKNDPLSIGFGLELASSQYFIANKYVIRRQLNRPKVETAAHSLETSAFYHRLIQDNTVLVFADAIHTTNMTKARATTFFRDGVDLDKLIESGKTENSIDRFYFHIASESNSIKVQFKVLAFTDHNFKTTVHQKKEGDAEGLINKARESKFKIDSILLTGNQSNYVVHELSNTHATIREYQLNPFKQNLMTYHNLLSCFAPLCEGGRTKGLVTLRYDKLFFFLEDRYLQVEDEDIFGSDVNVQDLKKYKKVDSIFGFPKDLQVDNHKEFYVKNFYFANQIETVISIGNSNYHLSYDSKSKDLRILSQTIKQDLKTDSYLAFTSVKFPIVKTEETQVNFFFKSGIEVRTYKEDEYTIKDVVAYQDKFVDARKFKSEIQLVAITAFSNNFANITFFSPDYTFTYKQRTNSLSELAERNKKIDIQTHVRMHAYKFMKCHDDYMKEKFEGLLPEKPLVDKAKYTGLLDFISQNVLIFSSLMSLLLIVGCIYFFGRKKKDDSKEKKQIEIFFKNAAEFMKKKERIKSSPKQSSRMSTVMPSQMPQGTQISAFSTVAGASVATTKTAAPRTNVFDSDISNAVRDERTIKVAGSGEYTPYKKMTGVGSLSQSMNEKTIESGFNVKRTQMPFSEQFARKDTELYSKSGKVSKASISDLIQKNIDLMKTTLQSKKS